MKIFNSLTRKKEEFETIEPMKIRMYVCGPTVYDFIHIGNARPMIVFDTFRRYMLFLGYDVNYVSNFTDIDDKIINRANELGISSEELANRFIDECKKDMQGMNIMEASTHPLATKEIDGMIKLIEGLVEKGYAYVGKDGTVYYDTTKFKEYGKLSHKNLDDLQSGFRDLKVSGEEDKKTFTDFVLWKPKKEGEPYWKSPWCDGRPGWHTECCVMAPKYCGGSLDIHAGGEDLVFPHHENEIAQYEPLYGEPYARYWMHNAFLNINNQKMSKSLGNFHTVREILEKFDGNVLRLFMLSTHYRAMLNFSYELMESSKASLERIENCINNIEFTLKNKNVTVSNGSKLDNIDDFNELIVDTKTNADFLPSELEAFDKICEYIKEYFDKLDDDLNTADAETQVYEIVRIVNQNVNESSSIEFLNTTLLILNTLLYILGIELNKKSVSNNIDEVLIEKMIAERTEAKKAKDYAKADEIRKKLLDMGIELEDTRQGVKWKAV
ncbi:MAG: cysteine--tRNA ligase [Lachnospiraceae bacterium]|nr:cysteine--tRNA ligase [Lachnospiraceae bacterium]